MRTRTRTRTRQPTALKILMGNPGKKSLPKHEAKIPLAIPDVPDHLSPEAKKEWWRVCSVLHNCGLMTEADRGALAAYCQAYGRWVMAEQELAKLSSDEDSLCGGLLSLSKTSGCDKQNPLVGIANKSMGDMMRYAIQFGMTPASRSNVQINKTADQPKTGIERFFA